ncbi:MAG: hypothetical protein D4R82_05210 [Dehalococcoidia bacterium]|nr:MAG: hypothetical protein D4R82_05210 [Dehalococcoidia bacterium]
MSDKSCRRKRCTNCGEILDAIWFTALMTEEWRWNGEGYNECSARHSLVTDPEQPVLCPHCENVVGTGLDFGFPKGYMIEY